MDLNDTPRSGALPRRATAPLALPTRLFAAGLLASTAACARTGETPLRSQLESAVASRPALASALCGYPVQGVTAYYVHPGEKQPRSGVEIHGETLTNGPGPTPATATIEGPPIASPGIPAGPLCAGKVTFSYQPDSNGSGGTTLPTLRGPIRVTERTTPFPSGVPDAERIPGFETENVGIPLSLPEPGEPPRTVYGTRTYPPHEAYIFMFSFDSGTVRLVAGCDDRPFGPDLSFFRDGGLRAQVSLGDDGKLQQEGSAVQLPTRPGDAYLLTTPGDHGLEILSECHQFRLTLDRPAPEPPTQ